MYLIYKVRVVTSKLAFYLGGASLFRLSILYLKFLKLFYKPCRFFRSCFRLSFLILLGLFLSFSFISCSGDNSNSNSSNTKTVDEEIVTEEENCSPEDFVNGTAKRSRSGSKDGPMGEWGDCIPQVCNDGFHIDNQACVSNTKDCSDDINGQGEQTWNVSTSEWSACVITSCNEDFYKIGNACVRVEIGYYSPSSGLASLSRQSCTNAGSYGTYTGMGGGADECSFDCNGGYYAVDANSACISVSPGYISSAADNSQTECTGPTIPNANKTTCISCKGNKIPNSAGDQCVNCSNSEYTTNNISCEADGGSCSIPNGQGIKSWNVSKRAWDSCQISSCDEDFYKLGNTCVTVELGYYSPSAGTASLSRQLCTNAGGKGAYTSTGGGTNNCTFTCNVGYHEESGTCMSNKKSCNITDGAGEQTWDGTKNIYSACVPKGCNAGHYKSPSSAICTDVDVGHASPTGDLTQTECAGNTVSNSDKSACVACGRGKQPNTDHTDCETPRNVVDCSATITDGSGSRTNGGPCTITGCNAGHYQPSTGADCTPVSSGYVSVGGALSQKQCAGTTKPNRAKSACENCPSSQHTEDNISCVSDTRSCSIANGQGEQAWDTDSEDWNSCTPNRCNVDFYRAGNACVPVDNGYYSLGTGADSLNREACTNGGSNVSYTSDGGGTNNCTYVCAGGHRKNKLSRCIPIQKRLCSRQVPYGIANGKQTYNPISEQWEGTCQIVSCNEDYYQSGNNCVAVGNGYYSTSTGTNSLKKLACGNLGGVIPGGTFTSDGGGSDSCSFTCNSEHHEDGTSYTCISNTAVCSITNGVGRKTWNPTLNSDAGGWNDCQMVGCNEDFYQTGSSPNFVCTQVAHGEYSEASSFVKGTCSNKPSDSKYKGRGGGSETGCSWACNGGYWKDSANSCKLTPIDYYSEDRSNNKLGCDNPAKPASNAHYTRQGETSQNCDWECNSGFVLDNGSCVNSNTLADIGNIQWESFPDKPAEASYDFSTKFSCVQGYSAQHYLYLKKVWLLDSDGVEESVFYNYTGTDGGGNKIISGWFDGVTRSPVKKVSITNAIMSLLESERGASGPRLSYTSQNGIITFTAPEGTGASWNSRQIKVKVASLGGCFKLAAGQLKTFSFLPEGGATISISFFGGSDEDRTTAISKGVLPIQDCFNAGGSNNSITIDGVVIPLGSNALSRLELAQKIAGTSFGTGTTYQTNPYRVTSNDHGEVIFTLDTSVNTNISIPIADGSYTKEACRLQSCGEDYYLSDGLCIPVGDGYYSVDSGTSSVNRVQCNQSGGGSITNGQFTGSGEGLDSCPFSCDLDYHKDGSAYTCVSNIDSCDIDDGGGKKLWDPRLNTGQGGWGACVPISCDADFYKQGNGCVDVAEGEYSAAGSLSKGTCTGKPAHSKYTSDGGGLASGCSWACDAGYWKNSSICEKTPRGFWSGDKDNQKHGCNAKPVANVYTQEGEQTANCTNIPGSRSCSMANGVVSGTQTWNVGTASWDGVCTITSCNEDYYKSGNNCVAVGNGYYSVASGTNSLIRSDCGGKSGTIANGQFTSDGSGADNCSFTCNQNYHENPNSPYTCVSSVSPCSINKGVGQKTWDTHTRTYGKCTIQSCHQDYYKIGNACEPVENGFYSVDSGANSLKRGACTNKHYYSDYTSSGSGSEKGCTWACKGGYYKPIDRDTCVLTPFGEYSPTENNKKFDCNALDIPKKATYFLEGESTDACSWKCTSGYILSDALGSGGSPVKGVCVQDGTLAGTDGFLTFAIDYTPASLSGKWPNLYDEGYGIIMQDEPSLTCAYDDIYLKEVMAINSDGSYPAFTFFKEKIPSRLIPDDDEVFTLAQALVSFLNLKLGVSDSTFQVVPKVSPKKDGLLFTAPEKSGAEWNGRKVHFTFLVILDYVDDRDCLVDGHADPRTLIGSFAGGSSAYTTATLEISDCLAASAANKTLTIDGVNIDLGSVAQTTAEIAATIAATIFTSGTLYDDHPYTVTSTPDNGNGGSTVTFTLDNSYTDPTEPLYIKVDDSSYTKASCSN